MTGFRIDSLGMTGTFVIDSPMKRQVALEDVMSHSRQGGAVTRLSAKACAPISQGEDGTIDGLKMPPHVHRVRAHTSAATGDVVHFELLPPAP